MSRELIAELEARVKWLDKNQETKITIEDAELLERAAAALRAQELAQDKGFVLGAQDALQRFVHPLPENASEEYAARVRKYEAALAARCHPTGAAR